MKDDKKKTEKKLDDKERMIDSVDLNENPVKVLITRPTPQNYRDSQVEYNKVFRKALDSGALLRQKLSDHMETQGLWDDEKQKKNDQFLDSITAKERMLKGGGIPLTEAKAIALELRELREEFRGFLAEKNSLDANSAEGQADNARFAELVRLCILNPDTRTACFPDQVAYDAQADQPWVIEASSELANMIYGLDPNYDNTLEENKFLKEFSFVNDDLRFINQDGHLVDIDGRLVNEDQRFIAYRTDKGYKNQDPKEVYFVDREGEEVISVIDDNGEEEWVKLSLKERKPFLDEKGKPIVADTAPADVMAEDSEVGESTDEDPPVAENKPQKRTRRNTKDTKST